MGISLRNHCREKTSVSFFRNSDFLSFVFIYSNIHLLDLCHNCILIVFFLFKHLQGAEPDLNTVAKMILNDWLRGKIPYYVSPPDNPILNDSSDTNQTASTNAVSLKSAISESNKPDKTPTGVQQIFSKIPVSTKFLPDDIKPLEEDEDALKQAQKSDEDDVKQKDAAQDAKKLKKLVPVEEITDWDEMFESVVGVETSSLESQSGKDKSKADHVDVTVNKNENISTAEEEDLSSAEEAGDDIAYSDDDLEEDDESTLHNDDENDDSEKNEKDVNPVKLIKGTSSKVKKAGLPKFTVKDKQTIKDEDEDDEDDDNKKKVKGSRMTTNKRKVGENFYDDANVKNKRRNKVKPVNPKTLTKQLRSKGNVRPQSRK